jgi:hypothetical protein
MSSLILAAICVLGYILLFGLLLAIFGGGADLGDRMVGAVCRRYDERQWQRDEQRAFELIGCRCPDFVPVEWEVERHG